MGEEARKIDKQFQFYGVIDTEGTFLYASKSHETILGWNNMLGTNCLDYIIPEEKDAAIHSLQEHKNNRKVRNASYHIAKRDGSIVRLDCLCVPVIENGKVTKFEVMSKISSKIRVELSGLFVFASKILTPLAFAISLDFTNIIDFGWI